MNSNITRGKRKEKPEEKTEVSEIDALPLYEELKKRWSSFIRKVYETAPLICKAVERIEQFKPNVVGLARGMVFS